MWTLGKQNKPKAKKRYLISGLDHLLRIGEQRHKLVWVLYLDGCAASLCHLFCLQPLRRRKPTTQHHLIQYSPVVHILLLLWGFFAFLCFFVRHFKPFLKFLKYLYPICDTVCILPPEGRLCTVTVINELVGFPLQCREQ